MTWSFVTACTFSVQIYFHFFYLGSSDDEEEKSVTSVKKRGEDFATLVQKAGTHVLYMETIKLSVRKGSWSVVLHRFRFLDSFKALDFVLTEVCAQ